MAKLGKVRLVEGKDGVFHVKLFLFRGELTPLAWVGSANFTGPGFGSNEELLYETKVTGALQKWFDRRWKEIGAQPDQPATYCEAWEPPDVPMPGVDGGANDGPSVITFVQEGTRPRPYVNGNGRRQPARGVVRIGRDTFPYESAQACLPLVLKALQQRDQGFLKRCSEDPRFHGRTRHYIARSESGLGTRPSREYAWEVCDGWWLTNQTENQLKWRLICAAADVAGLKVEVNGKMWYAEKTGRVQLVRSDPQLVLGESALARAQAPASSIR